MLILTFYNVIGNVLFMRVSLLVYKMTLIFSEFQAITMSVSHIIRSVVKGVLFFLKSWIPVVYGI